MTVPEENNMNDVNKTTIEAWALANKPRAKVLGLRLMGIQGKTTEAAKAAMAKEASLGEVEDQITTWAIENSLEARGLFMMLLPRILA